MTGERYDKLMDDQAELTPEEITAGWHFCWEFDGLLVGPGMGELDFCGCVPIGRQWAGMSDPQDPGWGRLLEPPCGD